MDQAEAIGYLLQHIGPLLSRQVDQIMQEKVGIGYSQFKLLQMLERVPEIRQHQMATNLGQTEASISRQIKLLAEKGLLVSAINPKSRREHIHRLTPKGTKMTQAVDAAMQQYVAPMLDKVPDKQQKQLLESLVHVHAWVCQPNRTTTCDHPFTL